jgi:hypothetical protein
LFIGYSSYPAKENNAGVEFYWQTSVWAVILSAQILRFRSRNSAKTLVCKVAGQARHKNSSRQQEIRGKSFSWYRQQRVKKVLSGFCKNVWSSSFLSAHHSIFLAWVFSRSEHLSLHSSIHFRLLIAVLFSFISSTKLWLIYSY